MVITREGSNPQRFIDSSQQLTELKVHHLNYVYILSVGVINQ